MALTAREIQDAYVTFFNRAADTEGFAYWTSYAGSISDLYATFAQQTEYTSVYGGKTAEQQITTVYQNLFNRAPDAEGLAYWKPLVEAGTITLANLALTVNRGAQGTDTTALTGKIDAAIVTTDAAVAANLPGQTFTLTTSADTLTGTAQADTFTADILTLTAGDILVGGDGVDTLNATINANVASTVSTTGIENVNITSLGASTIDMTKMTGVTSVGTKDSVGAITLNIATAKTLNFSGATTNDITANYKTGALSGAADQLVVNMTSANDVNVDVDAGFDSAIINVSGTGNSIQDVTSPGVTTVTIAGTGALTIDDDAMKSATDFIITNTAKISTGKMEALDVKSITATANTGGLVDADVSATTGYATNAIDGATTGLAMLLGSGDDNLKVDEAAASGKTNTIRLGAGDDRLHVENAGAGATYIFGDAGDDLILVDSVALETTDLISGGAGNDTLRITGDLVNNLTLLGVENLQLDGTTGALTTISSSDIAVAVNVKVADADDIDLGGLRAGDTVAVNELVASTAATLEIDTFSAKWGTTNAATTIDINVAAESDFTVVTDKVTALTLDFAQIAGAGGTTGSITTTATKNLVINSAKDIEFDGGIAAADDVLETLTINASDKVTLGAIANDAKLTTVSVTAVDNVSLGAIADADKLATFNVTSTAGSVTTLEIGDNGGTTTDPENIAITIAAATGIDFDLLEADKAGNISMTTATGSAVVDGITSAAAAGEISITATAGAIDLGNGTLGIVAADTTGITVNLSAKTFISDDGTDVSDDAVVTNSKGDITATLAGAAAANVNYTAGTINTAASSGVVNLNASTLTGGLTATITSHEVKGSTATNTISLGAKAASTVNTITLVGFTGGTTVNGSIGKDTIVNSDGGDVLGTPTTNSNDVYSGGDGVDTLSYAGNTHDALSGTGGAGATTDGYAMNFTGSQITFDVTPAASATNITYLAANTVAQYDSTATSSAATTAGNIVAGGETDSVSGFESVIGSAQADHIAVSNTGMTVQGGDGDDIIVLNAGADTVVFEDTAANNNADTINGFAAGASGDVLNFDAFLGASAAFLDAGSTTISGAIDGTNAGAETTGTAIAGKVVLIDTGTIADATALAGFIGKEAAAIDDKLLLANAGKAVVLLGDVNGTGTGDYLVYYVVGDDTNVEDSEVITLVGTLKSVDLDAFVASNLY